MNKRCVKCNDVKNINDFFIDNRLKDKHLGRCKNCCKEWVSSDEVKKRRNQQHKKYIEKYKNGLTESYVVRQLCHHNDLTPNLVRQYPELIESKKSLMILNRQIKKWKK